MKGTFGGEWNLNGFVGCLQKKPYRESLEQLFAALQQPIPMPGQSMPADPTQSYQNCVPVHTVDNSGAATMGLVFGIMSVVLGIFIPILGIILACLGFSRARMGAGSSKSGQAKVGKVLCIIGILVAVVMWGLNFLLLIPTVGSF